MNGALAQLLYRGSVNVIRTVLLLLLLQQKSMFNSLACRNTVTCEAVVSFGWVVEFRLSGFYCVGLIFHTTIKPAECEYFPISPVYTHAAAASVCIKPYTAVCTDQI